AIALPADIVSDGLAHSTTSSSGGGGGSGSSSSVPLTWSRARSFGQPSSGTGGNTRTCAVRCVTVIPGSASALRHSAPRARRTTFLMRPRSHARTASAHSPAPDAAGSVSSVSTARAAHSRASVRYGGAARSILTTSGRTRCSVCDSSTRQGCPCRPRPRTPPVFRRAGTAPCPASSVSADERAAAEGGDQRETLGVLGAGFRRVDHDVQVAALQGEDVAVEGDGARLRVVDRLAGGLVAAGDAGVPQLGEPVAVRA